MVVPTQHARHHGAEPTATCRDVSTGEPPDVPRTRRVTTATGGKWIATGHALHRRMVRRWQDVRRLMWTRVFSCAVGYSTNGPGTGGEPMKLATAFFCLQHQSIADRLACHYEGSECAACRANQSAGAGRLRKEPVGAKLDIEIFRGARAGVDRLRYPVRRGRRMERRMSCRTSERGGIRHPLPAPVSARRPTNTQTGRLLHADRFIVAQEVADDDSMGDGSVGCL